MKIINAIRDFMNYPISYDCYGQAFCPLHIVVIIAAAAGILLFCRVLGWIAGY